MSRCFGYCGMLTLVAVVSLCSPVFAAITITDFTNINLANSQTESGGDTSDNPNVVNGPTTGGLIGYTDSVNNGYCCGGSPFDGVNYDDGDIGTGVPSDGSYALPNNGTLTLDFGGVTRLGSIAMYNGYGNRDDGTYVLKNGAGSVLGGWTISGTGGTDNNGVDSFWIDFNSTVFSDKLLIDFAVTDASASFREIQVFTPEPTGALLALVGSVFGFAAWRRRSRGRS